MLLDAGRTRVLADEVGRQALHCIRCSACLNVCPVYSRTGGHAYGSVYPGPIGAILTPQLLGIEHAPTLPFASSLCGACYEVCPVKIDIPSVLRAPARARRSHAAGEPGRAARDAGASPGSSAGRRRFAPRAAARRGSRSARSSAAAMIRPPAAAARRPGRARATCARSPPESFREWWRRRSVSGARAS